jgi:hypothetical protein
MGEYIIGDFKCVLGVLLGIAQREVKPLIVTICVGVVLHEEHILILTLLLLVRAQQVSTLKTRIKHKSIIRKLLLHALLIKFFQHPEGVLLRVLKALEVNLIFCVKYPLRKADRQLLLSAYLFLL